MQGSFEILPHIGEVGVLGKGPSLNGSFAQAARALFSVMLEKPESVKPAQESSIEVTAKTLPLLLVNFLNELLYRMEIEGRFYSSFKVSIAGEEGNWRLSAIVKGEKMDFSRHATKVEVKAATLSNARVEQVQGTWHAQCVLDV